MAFRTLFTSLILGFCLLINAAALPVKVTQGESLRLVFQGKTLCEADSLDQEELERLRRWLKSPPLNLRLSALKNEILGAPVKLTVSPNIAKHWNTEPKTLASMFAARMNRALSESTPSWNVSGQLVPLSESRVIKIQSAGSGTWTLQSSDPDIFEIEALGSNRYRLSGKSIGRGQVSARSSKGRSLKPLPVSVKPWSSRWGKGPGRLKLWGPVTSKRVSKTLQRWLSARTLVGARVSVERLGQNSSGGHQFRLSSRAPGSIPVDKTITVGIQKVPSDSFDIAKQVMLSNHPERIISDGILYEREASALPFRLMWHHKNNDDQPERYLAIQLENRTPRTRRLRTLWQSYGPSPDEIHVGHIAAREYSVSGNNGLGEEIVLPPNSTRTVEIRRVKSGQTMSGMAYVQDLESSQGGVAVRVLAVRAGRALPQNEAKEKDPGRTASGVFPGDILTDASHLMGGPFTYLEFGGEPYESDLEGDYPSYGNFGSVYRTRLVVKNPHPEARTLRLNFASGGGAARGVLALDRELFDLPMGLSGEGVPVKTYLIEPGETRQIDVELFPQAGSNYPVRIVVRSDYERLDREQLEPLRRLVPAIP